MDLKHPPIGEFRPCVVSYKDAPCPSAPYWSSKLRARLQVAERVIEFARSNGLYITEVDALEKRVVVLDHMLRGGWRIQNRVSSVFGLDTTSKVMMALGPLSVQMHRVIDALAKGNDLDFALYRYLWDWRNSDTMIMGEVSNIGEYIYGE